MDINTLIVLEKTLFISFTIKDDKLCFELDEPSDKNLTFKLSKLCPDSEHCKSIIFRQDEYVMPLNVGKYVFTFNTSSKTALCVEFKDNKISFEIQR
jgi:hypothetical protein